MLPIFVDHFYPIERIYRCGRMWFVIFIESLYTWFIYFVMLYAQKFLTLVIKSKTHV